MIAKHSDLFKIVNSLILKISPRKVSFDNYPLYVTYYNTATDKVFIVVYERKNEIEIGMNLLHYHGPMKLESAKHMKYPNITKSLIIKNEKAISKHLISALKESFSNSEINEL